MSIDIERYRSGSRDQRTAHAGRSSALPHPSDNRGFTLLEVLFALGIFAIGILAVAGMQIRSVNLNAAARMQTEATVVAADWMERLAGLPFDDAQLDENGSPHQIVDGSYRVVWSITDDAPINQTKTIMLWVSSDNPNARDVIINFIKAQEP
ncbi:MAG TPA: prepilin-type N-terminal cleavage/methylation domain-containing protein [Desulfobacterales bacterium]